MPEGIKCKSCKEWNRVGTIYCHSCGEKLIQKISTRRHGGSFIFYLRGFLRLLIGVAGIGSLGLILWPVQPSGAIGDLADRKKFIEQVADLSEAADRGQRSVAALKEAGLNSYLAYLVEQQAGPESPGVLYAGTAGLNVTFTPNSLVALIIGAYGPVYLTYEIQGLPVAGEDGFRFDMSRVRLGHLPLPDVMGDIMVKRVADMFSKMEREKALLNKISKFQVEDGRIIAGVK